jgi:hypothetical protein
MASKIIQSFNLDLSDLPATAEARSFTVRGDNDAEFILEIKNSSNYYYNFTTNTFTATKTNLQKAITNGFYENSIIFPNIKTKDTVNGAVTSGVKVVMDTVVASTMAVGDRVTGNTFLNNNYVTVAALNPDDDNTSEFSLSEAVVIADDVTLIFAGSDQYDVYLYAKSGTEFTDYIEARFADGSLDINNSIGSNSLLMQKVIYQYPELVLTLSTYSPNSTIETGSQFNADINISRVKSKSPIAFSVACSVSTATKTYQIIKQPSTNDILSYASLTIGSAPEDLPGENIYPTARDAFTGDDVNGAVTAEDVVRMDNTDLSAVIAVGDKITTTVMTDTVNGARDASAVAVTMDSAVATKMAVGDRVTGNAALDARLFTVASLDSTNVFSLSSTVAIADGVTLSFSSKINRSLTTVTVVETSSTATDFTMSQDIQFRDNAPLTFWPRKNYRWPINDISKLAVGASLLTGANVTASSYIKKYQDTITVLANTEDEETIVKNEAPALDTKNQTPTMVNGKVTVQPGNVIFNNQQALLLAGDTVKIGSYGENGVLNTHGYNVKFTDLAIRLVPTITTTTAAVVNSTSVAVATRNGILDNVSTVSGIGINPSLANPKVSSGAGSVSGAGTIVLDGAQNLESGATLTFAGASQTVNITGNIEILEAGTTSQSVYFDVEKLLSIT